MRIVFASNNAGKTEEVAAMLRPLGLALLPQSHFHVPEVEETGLSFVENALIKARNACRHTGLPAIGDDSGLEVDALDGEPGIYSSRYAGESATDRDNNTLLLAELAGVPEQERTARFQCVMALLRHADDPTPIICQGTWEGRILTAPDGSGGFGYDPLFYIQAEGCSAARLNPDNKNRLSHRGQALRQLLERLRPGLRRG
ncbi:RdgB/HAM1 family non-canonical purine NTP pyrophosphatase [Methylonatrum kenyense]|uniref:RdgB/HAM1 family non-canonical purine NTP pyrophosphatase n=1 Tax=Methylonatrum kenyense TaxID=455253 RepID=UPI0020BE4A4E|nr:RdgB/HAM1 family non-canonical purine NTP pyrophosphatase [Methylonatrum kenyense]MCK8516861.1 RdgB/HAM1 family non-canonical purine NTP pyrophosphatase [Methylonatrum kenyense]